MLIGDYHTLSFTQALTYLCKLTIQFLAAQVTVDEIPHLHLPDVCTESPLPRKAFCQEHCQLLEKHAPQIPTGLREFLKYSGVTKEDNGGVKLCNIYYYTHHYNSCCLIISSYL